MIEKHIASLEDTMNKVINTDFNEAIEISQVMFSLAFEMGLHCWRAPDLLQTAAVLAFIERWMDGRRIDLVVTSSAKLHTKITSELEVHRYRYYSHHPLSIKEICEIYSGGRFLHEIFGAAILDSNYGLADEYLEDLQVVLERLGSPDVVPDGIPESHFWWFIEKKDSADAEDWYF